MPGVSVNRPHPGGGIASATAIARLSRSSARVALTRDRRRRQPRAAQWVYCRAPKGRKRRETRSVCGICGYAGDHRPELLDAMTTAMAHRGPDGAGTWSDRDAQVGLGHRRLAIIDLSTAATSRWPTRTARSGSSFNGEIYNFQRAARGALEAQGPPLPQPDRHRGARPPLRGTRRRHAVEQLQRHVRVRALGRDASASCSLARDRVGIKPLYYWHGRPAASASPRRSRRCCAIPRCRASCNVAAAARST